MVLLFIPQSKNYFIGADFHSYAGGHVKQQSCSFKDGFRSIQYLKGTRTNIYLKVTKLIFGSQKIWESVVSRYSKRWLGQILKFLFSHGFSNSKQTRCNNRFLGLTLLDQWTDCKKTRRHVF